jgi:hypothetical protein
MKMVFNAFITRVLAISMTLITELPASAARYAKSEKRRRRV